VARGRRQARPRKLKSPPPDSPPLRAELFARLFVGPSLQKFNPRWLAPLGYAATSVGLVLLASRAITTFGGNVTLGHLLDPRYLYLGSHGLVVFVTLLLLAAAVWRRSQLAIFLTHQTLLSLAFIDVLHFIGTQPGKIDFRLRYPIELALELAWLAALCCLASLIVVARGRLEDG
jgi:hypothetical protein